MKIGEKKAQLRELKKSYLAKVEEVNGQIAILKNATQPTKKDLYNGIDKYFTYVVEKKTYATFKEVRNKRKVIERTGKVLTVTLDSKYYFNDELLMIIEGYISMSEEYEKIEFIGNYN